MVVDDAAVQVISATHAEWIHPFTGLTPAQFRRLVRVVAQRAGPARFCASSAAFDPNRNTYYLDHRRGRIGRRYLVPTPSILALLGIDA